MSEMGQKRKCSLRADESALPPESGHQAVGLRQIRFVPQPNSCTATYNTLFDHLVGDRE